MIAESFRRPMFLVAMLAAIPALADGPRDAPSQAPGVRMTAVVVGPDPTGAAGTTGYHMELVAQEGAIRANFVTAAGLAGTLIQPRDSTTNWLMAPEAGVVLPFEGDGLRPLFVDGDEPCAAMGGRCQRLQARRFGTVEAAGWRYRGARRGPGGSTDGEFWVDEARGLIVAYEGRYRSQTLSMHPVSIRSESLPEALFEPPEQSDLSESPREQPSTANR